MLSKFYINLARSTARREFMEDQFAALGWDVERIEAVDGAHLQEADHPPLTDWAKNTLLMTKGEIGCFMSHQVAWQRIADGSEPFGLVLEDDILISKAALPLLDNLDWIPADCDCVKLDIGGIPAFQGRPKPISVPGFSLTWPLTHLYSTASYLISQKAASRLCNEIKKIGAPVDVIMFRRDHRNASGLNYYQLYPAMAVQQAYKRSNRFLPDDAETSTPGMRVRKKSKRPAPKGGIRAIFQRRHAVVKRRLRAIYYFVRHRATRRRVPFIDSLE